MASRKIKVADKSVIKQPRHELLQVAEAVAREKNIDKEEAIFALEGAIQKVAQTKYGSEHNIRATIHPNTGEISVFRVVTVVENVENSASEISLDEARIVEKNAEIGYEFTEELPSFDFGRAAAQGARQIIVQRIRQAEREHQYKEFEGRKGDIVSGVVKQIDYNNVIVDIGRTEGIIRKEDNIPRQIFRIGDRIKALLVDIKPESSGPMIILSRTANEFIVQLFKQEVTEIYDGLIKIVSVARDPGSRSKIAVYSADNRLDPVGSCVGVRGSRVQAVMNELGGEKIDIIPLSSDPATYVVNALSLPDVKRVVIEEEEEKMNVVVDDELLSQAIGRRGQNVKLASMLTGWKITVSSETSDIERRNLEQTVRIKSLTTELEIDELMAQLLIAEGFLSAEDIAQSEIDDFLAIEGFDENLATEVRSRAINFVEKQETEFFKKCKELNINDDLLTIEELDISAFMKLIDAGIKSRDDLADLSSEELLEIIEEGIITKEKADSIIMEARQSWFQENSSKEVLEEDNKG